MAYFSLRQFHDITGNALHILRRDAKLLFPTKQSQGVISEYTLNEGFVLYLYAYLVSVKKFTLEEAYSIISKLLLYLNKKGLLPQVPEGKMPEADEYRDKKFDDQLGQTYTIPNAAIYYPTRVSVFESTMYGPEDQIINDFCIVANREGVKEHNQADGHQVTMVRRITEMIHEPGEGFEIDSTQEWVVPVSKLLEKFKERKYHYDFTD